MSRHWAGIGETIGCGTSFTLDADANALVHTLLHTWNLAQPPVVFFWINVEQPRASSSFVCEGFCRKNGHKWRPQSSAPMGSRLGLVSIDLRMLGSNLHCNTHQHMQSYLQAQKPAVCLLFQKHAFLQGSTFCFFQPFSIFAFSRFWSKWRKARDVLLVGWFVEPFEICPIYNAPKRMDIFVMFSTIYQITHFWDLLILDQTGQPSKPKGFPRFEWQFGRRASVNEILNLLHRATYP